MTQWDDDNERALRAAREAVSILEAQKSRALGAQGEPASPPSVRAPAAAALDSKGWHRDSGKTSVAAALYAKGWHRDATTGGAADAADPLRRPSADRPRRNGQLGAARRTLPRAPLEKEVEVSRISIAFLPCLYHPSPARR